MRVLALDLGNKRIGAALSDSTGLIARPLLVFKRTSRVADFATIARLITEHNVACLVVGLPISMDGSEGSQAAWVRDYCAALGATLPIPLHLWDERLTTHAAEELLREQGKRPDPQWIDAVAAAVILQNYLDAQHVKRDA